MSAKPNNLILNGFDRCGSTAMARTLARHPEVEVLMQPFNSGSIRSKLSQPRKSDRAALAIKLLGSW